MNNLIMDGISVQVIQRLPLFVTIYEEKSLSFLMIYCLVISVV